MEPVVSVATLILLGKIIGSIMTLGGVVLGAVRVINWIKGKFISIENNVIELKQELNTHMTGLRDDIKEQTRVLSTGLSEQRQDFRTFYGPIMMMQQLQQQPAAAPARKRAPKKKA